MPRHPSFLPARVDGSWSVTDPSPQMHAVSCCLCISLWPRILAQPCAASAAERNWSIYGQIRAAHRSRMKHATADKLVYAHEALHLEQKMQGAGWLTGRLVHF